MAASSFKGINDESTVILSVVEINKFMQTNNKLIYTSLSNILTNTTHSSIQSSKVSKFRIVKLVIKIPCLTK